MPADGNPARVIPLDLATRRRPAVRRSRIGAERAPGVEVLTDAELDDELAAAQSDADADLDALLSCPIPRDEDARLLLVGRLAGRLAMEAINAFEVDASQVDVRDEYAATLDAIVARLGAVRGAR